LKTDLSFLQDNPYLMEDVWVHPSTEAAPPWLTDTKVWKGICAMLKNNQCTEEYRQLGIEADNLCQWFGRELVAIELAIQTTLSKLSTLILSHASNTILRRSFVFTTAFARVPVNHLSPNPLAHTTHTQTCPRLSCSKCNRHFLAHLWEAAKAPHPPLASLPNLTLTEYHDDLHSDTDADEWDDIPYLYSMQEMFADVITKDRATEIQIDSVWAPSVCDSM